MPQTPAPVGLVQRLTMHADIMSLGDKVSWQTTVELLREAAAALAASPGVNTEPDKDRCTVCRADYPTGGQQVGTRWGIWGPGVDVLRSLQHQKTEEQDARLGSGMAVGRWKKHRRSAR